MALLPDDIIAFLLQYGKSHAGFSDCKEPEKEIQ